MFFAAEAGLRTLRVHKSANLSAEDLLAICDAASSGQAISAGRNRIWALDWGERVLAVKSFGIPWGVRKWIYGSIRRSKARRSFENATTLISLGPYTPKPIGYAEFGDRSHLIESFYVSEYLPISNDAFPLRDVLLDACWPDREVILSAFGQFTCKLHDMGILHRDYSPGNVLVVASKTDLERKQTSSHIADSPEEMRTQCSKRSYRFELVDLNRMSFGKVNTKHRMENLRHLWADDNDLRIIVTGYAGGLTLPIATLWNFAWRASQNHKKKASREERMKRLLRSWLRNGQSAENS